MLIVSLQRVGSKGPAAEMTRALVGRMAPTLLSPELLHAVMEQAGENKDGEHERQQRAAVAAVPCWRCCCAQHALL